MPTITFKNDERIKLIRTFERRLKRNIGYVYQEHKVENITEEEYNTLKAKPATTFKNGVVPTLTEKYYGSGKPIEVEDSGSYGYLDPTSGQYNIIKGKDITPEMKKSGNIFKCINPEEYKKLSDTDKAGYKAMSNDSLVPIENMDNLFVVTGKGTCVPLSSMPELIVTGKDGKQYINVTKLGSQEIRERNTTSGTEYVNADATGDVGITDATGAKHSEEILTIDEAIAKYKEDFNTAWSGLQHSFTDMDEAKLKDKFSVVVFNDGSFGFVYTEHIADPGVECTIFQSTTGKYEKEMDKDCYTFQYDAKGNLTGIRTDEGQAAALHPTQTYDELAYDEAMSSYEYEKILYDREQNRLNQQTSIYDNNLVQRYFFQTNGDKVNVYSYDARTGLYREDGEFSKGYLDKSAVGSNILLTDLIASDPEIRWSNDPNYSTEDHMVGVKIVTVNDEELKLLYVRAKDDEYAEQHYGVANN